MFEKLLLKKLKSIIQKTKLILEYKFGFRQKHLTVDQVHRITYVIEKALEEKQICSALFLDVAQTLQIILMYKLNDMQFVEILTS